MSELFSPTPTTPMPTPSPHAMDSINVENIDALGILHDGADSDEGDEEGAEEDNDIAIRASAPSQA